MVDCCTDDIAVVVGDIGDDGDAVVCMACGVVACCTDDIAVSVMGGDIGDDGDAVVCMACGVVDCCTDEIAVGVGGNIGDVGGVDDESMSAFATVMVAGAASMLNTAVACGVASTVAEGSGISRIVMSAPGESSSTR